MGEMRRITVEIDGDTARVVDMAVVAGEYDSDAEVVLEALRLWSGAYQSDDDLRLQWEDRTRAGQWLEGNFTLAEITAPAANGVD